MTRLLALAVTVLVLFGILVMAQAHDRFGNANWISKGHYTSPTDGSHCCGPLDCVQVDPEYVREVQGGYWISGPVTYQGGASKGDTIQIINEVVPHREVQVSKDGAIWRCKKPDGTRRCFFFPPGST